LELHFRSLYRLCFPINPDRAELQLYLSDVHAPADSPCELLPDHPLELVVHWGDPDGPGRTLTFGEATKLLTALTEGLEIVKAAAEAWCSCGEPRRETQAICWRCEHKAGIAERKTRKAAMRVLP
jgi:hypothetical protein